MILLGSIVAVFPSTERNASLVLRAENNYTYKLCCEYKRF